ncbi:MAG TPA: YCF48-related protein [Candidatus Kapabacteria bacterium]|nr:YCF48-related protein [Candidatus Kapabacteria bacterium]
MKLRLAIRVLIFFLTLVSGATTVYSQTDTTSGWQLVLSNPRYKFDYLKFFSLDTGYAIAENGTTRILLRTFDGGLTWDTLSTPIPSNPTVFVTPLVGFSESDFANGVYKTIDGGMSWQPYDRNSDAYGPIAFANIDTGLVMQGTVARTTNGGTNWYQSASIQTAAHIYAASFGDAVTCYAVGEPASYPPDPHLPGAGLCAKTTDAGASWTQVYTTIPYSLLCCAALGANTLIVGGAERSVGRTTNGGITWDTMYYGDQYSLYDAVSFANFLHGMMVGAATPTSGIILATNDGGKTWQRQYIPNAPWLVGVQMLNDSVAVVCGSGNIYRTTTGGNFSSVSQPQSPDFQAQVFPNPTPGLVNIQYQLPSATSVSFLYTDVQGNILNSTTPQLQDAGMHQIVFDGSMLANGAYYFQLTTPQGSYSGSFTIIK